MPDPPYTTTDRPNLAPQVKRLVDTICHDAELSVIQDFPNYIEELEKLLQVSPLQSSLNWLLNHLQFLAEFPASRSNHLLA